MLAEQSANWVINQILLWQQGAAQPLPVRYYALYRTSVFDLRDEDRSDVTAAINAGVHAIRAVVTQEKLNGAATVRVRRGLRLPLEWQAHYQVTYSTQCPWLISAVTQSAFLENRAAHETRKWRSR